jgi:hypothetical protein
MTQDDWLKLYEDNPLDFALLLPWSDWYEEQGDPRAAACLRWCYQHQRAPDSIKYSKLWWNDMIADPGTASPGDLPKCLWNELTGDKSQGWASCRYFRARDALMALLQVWQKHAPQETCGHPACCTEGDLVMDRRGQSMIKWHCLLCAWKPVGTT